MSCANHLDTNLAASAEPEYLYTAAEVREFDRRAIEELGIPGFGLMQAAARAAFDCIQRHYLSSNTLSSNTAGAFASDTNSALTNKLLGVQKSMTVFCGHGNNGGDGFVIAALASQALWQVQVVLLGAPEKITGDARLAYDMACAQGVAMLAIEDFIAAEDVSGVLVDALLGTGIHSPVRDAFARAIAIINASTAAVFAVDMPSGINADTGAVMGAAVRADHCISFIARKRGAYTGAGPAHIGHGEFADLGLPETVFERTGKTVEVIRVPAARAALPARAADAHKGRFGHVLVIGGNYGMAGAALMTGSAALRCGAGLVSVATRPEHIAALVARQPELMAHGISASSQIDTLLAAASVVIVGPGLGQDSWAQELLRSAAQHCVQAGLPLLLDADALNLVANRIVDITLPPHTILTPHPGEAARLLATSAAGIQADRFSALQALQKKYAAVCILKGAGSLVSGATATDMVGLCTEGNPGMATAGMGDILSGVVGALLAQGLASVDAARLGVYCMRRPVMTVPGPAASTA